MLKITDIKKTTGSSFKTIFESSRVVFWLIQEIYLFNKKKLIYIISSSLSGIVILGFSIGLLLGYVKKLEGGDIFELLSFTFESRDIYLLALVSVTAMLLLITGAWLLLKAKLTVKNLIVDLNLSGLGGLAARFGWHPFDEAAWISDTALYSKVAVRNRTDMRRAGLTIRRIFEGFQHCLIVIAGIGALLWINLQATLYLLLFIAFALIFYYKINRRASKSTRGVEKNQIYISKYSKTLISAVATWPNPALDSSVLQRHTHSPFMKESIHLVFDKFSTRAITEFISYVSTAVVLAFLVFTMGYAAISDNITWALLVAYIFILRTVMQSLKSMFQMLVIISREYPVIERLFQFSRSGKRVPGKPVTELKLSLKENGLSENNKRDMVLKKGDAAVIAAPVSLSRYSTAYFAELFTGKKSRKSNRRAINSMAIAVPVSFPDIEVPLKDILGLPSDWTETELKSALGKEAAAVEKAFQPDPEKPVSRAGWVALTSKSRKKLSLLSIESSDSPLLLVHDSLITKSWLREKKEFLKKRVLIICRGSIPAKDIFPGYGFSYIVTGADCSVAGFGSFSWLRKNRGRLEIILHEIVVKLVGSEFASSGGSELQDDDDD